MIVSVLLDGIGFTGGVVQAEATTTCAPDPQALTTALSLTIRQDEEIVATHACPTGEVACSTEVAYSFISTPMRPTTSVRAEAVVVWTLDEGTWTTLHSCAPASEGTSVATCSGDATIETAGGIPQGTEVGDLVSAEPGSASAVGYLDPEYLAAHPTTLPLTCHPDHQAQHVMATNENGIKSATFYGYGQSHCNPLAEYMSVQGLILRAGSQVWSGPKRACATNAPEEVCTRILDGDVVWSCKPCVLGVTYVVKSVHEFRIPADMVWTFYPTDGFECSYSNSNDLHTCVSEIDYAM